MMSRQMIKKGLVIGQQAGRTAWRIARSEQTIALIKVAATFVALVAAIEELRRVNRKIGFRK